MQRTDPPVLVPASDQQRDWYARERQHRNPDLVSSFRFSVHADIPPESLGRAAERLVLRHGALRTCFVQREDGELLQAVHPNVPAGVFWSADLRSLSPEDQAKAYQELVVREYSFVFDLEQLPLTRIGLIRLSSEYSVVSITLHHIIADGWSLGVIRQDLSTLLSAEVTGAESQLPPVMQLYEWSEGERRWVAGAEAADQLAYWSKLLADVSPMSIPPTRVSRGGPYFENAEMRRPVSKATHDKLRYTALRYRTTPTVVVLTAYLKLLSIVTGRADVATMILVSGRAGPPHFVVKPPYDRLVGSLTNSLTLPANRVAGRTVDELLRQVHDQVLAAYENQRLFVARAWERSALGPGVVDSLFIFDAFKDPPKEFGPYRASPPPAESPRVFQRDGKEWENFKLRFTSSPTNPMVSIDYNRRLYDESFVDDFGSRFIEQLEGLRSS
jgi:Condensation domain